MSHTRLPEYYLVTPEPHSGAVADRRIFIEQLAASLATGAMLVQLRAKTLQPDDFAALAAEAIACCHAHDTRVMLNGAIGPAAAFALGADGIHLGSVALHALATRPVPDEALLSVACHTLQDLRQAAAIGADCAVLSPVLATLSHPGAPTLGWQTFAAWSSQVEVPVYALGGMTRAHLPLARAHGAQGIASIRGLWPTSVPG
jgi:thiamine-phosphate pyrophosphorylase